jgi:site-specific DNA recombinase
MKKVCSYIRVSTEQQAEHGVSLENQSARIRAYCEFRGYQIVEEIRDEGISGGKNKGRCGFMDLLDRVEQNGIDCVVLYSLERISRDMLTLLSLERLFHEFGVEIETVDDGGLDTSTPDKWIAFAMKCVLSEHERRQVQYRTKRALEHKRANGQVTGRIPFGFQREGDNLVPVESEQTVIQRVNQIYTEGKRLKDIVCDLNSSGYRTRTGGEWKPHLVSRLIEGYEGSFKKGKSAIGDAIRQFIEAIA